MAEKHRFSARVTTNEETEVGREDEEIYENIEAPKFVDFTKPEHIHNRTDDRYWFCLRVGCDQKHEEELDHETISKNFILRVMAARSPNVRLNRIMNRKTPRPLKCPLSVPAKPSKSRLSRLALISSFSKKKKLVDSQKDKLQQQQKPSNPNLNSTPKLQKVRPVAAKYLTTPRNKKSLLPKPNSFHSVQNNMKPIRISFPKNSKMVAKALLFSSPKKGINLRASAELKTPLSKICKGMKKLRLEQTIPIESSRKQGTSIKDRSKIKKVVCNEKNVKTKSKEEGSKKKPISSKSNEDDLANGHGKLLEKEKTVIIQEADVPSVGNYDEEEDDKENALISESNNNSELNDNGAQMIERENIVDIKETNNSKQLTCQAKEQISKDGMKKYKKLKVTNPKPFRLRTDERGILKESILERKISIPVPQKEEPAIVSMISNTTKCENGNLEKKKKASPSPLKSIVKPKGSATNTTTTRPDIKQLSPIKEKEKSRKTLKEASSASAKSTSRGKRPMTVPKESIQKTICQQKDRTVIRI